jgi:hypothetical protein
VKDVLHAEIRNPISSGVSAFIVYAIILLHTSFYVKTGFICGCNPLGIPNMPMSAASHQLLLDKDTNK